MAEILKGKVRCAFMFRYAISRMGFTFNATGRQYLRRGVAKVLDDRVDFSTRIRKERAMIALSEKPVHETMPVRAKGKLGGSYESGVRNTLCRRK